MKKLMLMLLMTTFVVAITNCATNNPKTQKKDKCTSQSKDSKKENLPKKGGDKFEHRKYWKLIKIPL